MEDALSEQLVVHTIGHSNLQSEEFLGLLKKHGLDGIVDVRSSPYSRYVPHFNREVLEDYLQSKGIRYVFLGDMIGGRPAETKFYDRDGYVLYNLLAESPLFKKGIDRLIDEIAMYKVALLCGEENPAECHRRLLIGRVLADMDVKVLHIRGNGQVETETDIATEEEYRRTKGQLSFFTVEDKKEWKSTQSVLHKRPPQTSSQAYDEWE